MFRKKIPSYLAGVFLGSFAGIFLFAWEEVGLFLRIIDLVSKFLFVPIQLSVFANIYVKKLHEQFDYYF